MHIRGKIRLFLTNSYFKKMKFSAPMTKGKIPSWQEKNPTIKLLHKHFGNSLGISCRKYHKVSENSRQLSENLRLMKGIFLKVHH